MRVVQQAGGIILNHKGQIAIITSTKGLKTLPKGSREPGEKFIETARRKIYEETGLKEIAVHDELGILVRPGYTASNHSEPTVIKKISFILCNHRGKRTATSDAGRTWSRMGRYRQSRNDIELARRERIF